MMREDHADPERPQLEQVLERWRQVQATPQGQAASALAAAIGGLAFAGQRSRKFREARAWCWNDNRRQRRAFLNQCDVLGIAPRALRRHLRDLLRDRARRAARVRKRQARQINPSALELKSAFAKRTQEDRGVDVGARSKGST